MQSEGTERVEAARSREISREGQGRKVATETVALVLLRRGNCCVEARPKSCDRNRHFVLVALRNRHFGDVGRGEKHA